MEDIEIVPCPECLEFIFTFWTEDGLLPNSQYILIADWVFHTECWYKLMKEYTDAFHL